MGGRLRSAITRCKESPALLSVLLLQLILNALLAILFVLVDIAIVTYLNRELIGATSTVAFEAMLNTKTVLALGTLLIIEVFALLYIDSFFLAGAYGMMRNAIQDGTTVFDEFLPSAKRYWYAMFRYLVIRTSLAIIAFAPFIIVSLMLRSSVWSSAPTVILASLFVSILLSIAVVYVCLYAEAIIVFHDASALEAVAGSWKHGRALVGTTSGTTAVYLLVLGCGAVLAVVLHMPFEMLANTQQTILWQTTSAIMQFLLNVVFLIASIIGMLYIFDSYGDMTRTNRDVLSPSGHEHKRATKKTT